MSTDTQAQTCDCKEYIYLNETSTGGAVHKFEVNADGSFTEVGSPWYDNTVTGDDLNSPHGVTSDLNGFLYIGETAGGNQIRKLNCVGEILPETTFAITNGGQTNLISLEGYLYANDWESDTWNKYDLCTQQLLGRVTNCDGTQRNWGLHYDDSTGTFYATSGTNEPSFLYVFTDADFDNDPTTCITGISLPYPNNNKVRGITQDSNGLYI